MNNTTKKIELPRDLVIPTKLAFSKDIPDEYKFLYMYISFRASTRGYIWYKNEVLAEHIDKHERSIKRGLKALADAKWIKIENRVKKGDLYHQDLRRAIWIYSDYLVALDKGGYGVARPLAFSTWKKRFVSALIDSSKIPLVMHFFPTAQKMGDMGVNYEAESKKLYAYQLNEQKKYETRQLNTNEVEQFYKELYEFYISQHKTTPAPDIKDFNDFQNHIMKEYIDKEIATVQEKVITINGLGMLMEIDKDNETKLIETSYSSQIWDWLFSHQNEITRNSK